MKMRFRIAMLLALLMTLSLCSCGGGSASSETDTNTETNIERLDTETETETEALLEKIDETGNGNRVMTFAMGRERTKAISGSYNTWGNRGEWTEHKPDCTTEEGLRDIASVYYPSIGLYDVTDPDYQEYMMQLCRMCYIDTINYYLHSTDDLSASKSVWSKSFDDLTLDMLRKYGLSSSARLASWDDDAKAGQYFTALLDKLEETVLTIEGRPVLAQFTMNTMTSAQASKWKDDYAATHNGVEPFLMMPQSGGYLSGGWPQVADGQYGWVELDDQKDFLEFDTNVGVYRKYVTLEDALANHVKTATRAKQYATDGIVPFYSESVTPGFDDRGCWGWGTGPRKVEGGDNAELYIAKWESAVKNQFPMVTIPTWDDWGEATSIEPSLQYGIEYLELTRKYAAQYKGLEANTASLELPGWIYKIRKTTTDKDILAVMDAASDLIAAGHYEEAEKLVKPYVEKTGIPATSKEFFNFPNTPTTPLPSDIPTEGKDPVVSGTKETHFPNADTFVVISRTGGRDAGTENKLRIKSAKSTNLTRQMYIQFDLTGSAITDVQKATIRLYCTYSNENADEINGRDINLYATVTGWKENSFGWNDQPAVIEKVADIDTSSYRSNRWVEIDVTDYVKAHAGEVISFTFRNEGADTEKNHLEFYSREQAGMEPQLVIE